MLRPYQQLLIDKIKIKARLGEPICCVACTGSGKSHVIAAVCQGATQKGSSVLVLAHRKELIRQNQSKLGSGEIYSAGLGSKNTGLITFGTIASVFAAKEKFLGTKIIIVDEAHKLNTRAIGMYRVLIDYLKPDLVIGFTATPFRLSKGKNVSIVDESLFFTQAVIGESVGELIRQGYLSPLISKVAKEQANLTGVAKDTTGDFKESEVASRMMQLPNAVTEIAEAIKEGNRKKTIVFSSGIEHAEELEKQFTSLGFSAKAVTSNTGDLFRDQYIQDFLAGNIQILIGAMIFTEGFDAPDIDCVAILRATESLALFHQIVGRGLRIAPGKDNCLILDFGKNFERHGTLEDFKLEQESKSLKLGTAPVKICPSCQHLQHLSAKTCKNCFFEFPIADKLSRLSSEAWDGDPIEQIEPRFLQVSEISYRPHTSKKGRGCMRVDYVCVDSGGDTAGKFSEWVSMPDIEEAMQGNHAELFLAKKLEEWLQARGLAQEMIDCINSVDDLLMAMYSVTHPPEIMITPDPKNDRFNRIRAIFDNPAYEPPEITVLTEEPKLASDSTYWGK
jgi:DNA repair protein RadD